MTSQGEDIANELEFSLVRNDLFFRLQRRIGLIPENSLGVKRRILFWSLFTWLPIAVWSVTAGYQIPSGESLMQHFGVTVRCLVAIPLFILGEAAFHNLSVRLVPYFVESGLVSPPEVPRFREIVRGLARFYFTVIPWLVILGVIVARGTMPLAESELHGLTWAMDPSANASQLGFGGWWFLYVARSVYLLLAMASLWRLILLVLLFARLSKLDLSIVPTHPDRAGGLGFIQRCPKAFAMVVFAISAVPSAHWAHEVLYHGVSVSTLRVYMISLGVAILLIFLAPSLLWVQTLVAARKLALLEYGTLVAGHGRLVRGRWILKQPVEDTAVLSAPELGPLVDVLSIYQAVQNMRAIPIDRAAFLALAVPIAIPMLVVLGIQIPIKEILLALLKVVA